MCSLHCQPGQGTWGQEGVGNWDQVWWLQGWSSSSLLAHWTPQGSQDCIQTKASSPLQYADPVTDLLDRCGVFRARLFRESCVFHQGCYVKDLSRLGRDLRKTLILDNSPASYIFHPENAVSVPGPHTAGRGRAAAVEPGFSRGVQHHGWAQPTLAALEQWRAELAVRRLTPPSPCPRCPCSLGLMTWQTLSC